MFVACGPRVSFVVHFLLSWYLVHSFLYWPSSGSHLSSGAAMSGVRLSRSSFMGVVGLIDFGVRLPPSCVHISLVHLVPCLPDILSRPGFRKKKSSLMSPLR